MSHGETFRVEPRKAFRGMIADQSTGSIISRTIEDADGITWAVPVAHGASDHGCRTIGATTYTATVDSTGIHTNGPTLTLTANSETGSEVIAGDYTLHAISTGNSGRFAVELPNGVSLPSAVTGVAYTSDHLNFTIAAGTSAVAIGDTFTVTVTPEDATIGKFLGFTVRSQSERPESVDRYPVGETAAIMILGAIWVEVSEDVTAGSDVWVLLSDATLSGSAGDGKIKLPKAVFESDASADDYARVRVG